MAEKKKPEPKPSGYDSWLARLSPQARSKLSGDPVEADDDFARWQAVLSPKARQAIAAAAPPTDVPAPDDMRYSIVEAHDGELPVVRLFPNAEAMARHLGKLEGKDCVVVPFYGAYLPFSVGPHRYVLLPGKAAVLTVPLAGKGACRRLDLELVDCEWQEDGFVGPPELADSGALAAELDAMRDDEDEDESDD